VAEYQKIEYRIGKDGKIIETVIGGSGPSCVDLTQVIESDLGIVESQELLPEYYESCESLTTETPQSLPQG